MQMYARTVMWTLWFVGLCRSSGRDARWTLTDLEGQECVLCCSTVIVLEVFIINTNEYYDLPRLKNVHTVLGIG